MIKITNKFLLILNLNLINSINSQILKSNQVKSCSNSISSLNSLTLTESLINFDTGKYNYYNIFYFSKKIET